jgi:hypothetical protein
LKAICTTAALIYTLVNGALAIAALRLMQLFNVPQNSPIEQLNAIVVAGLGSMLVLRSKLFSVKVGGDDKEQVSIGPDELVRIYLRFLEAEIDRERSLARMTFVRRLMRNIDFDRVKLYAVTMLDSPQTLSVDERNQIVKIIEDISNQSSIDSQMKSFRLGFVLINAMGEAFLEEVCRNEDGSSFSLKPEPKRSAWISVMEFFRREKRQPFFAYATAASPEQLAEYLHWTQADIRVNIPKRPRRCTLKGYRLTFETPFDKGRHPGRGTANIQLSPEDKVEGVLYDMPLEVIDFVEQRLGAYRLEKVTVEIDGENIECLTNVARDPQPGYKPHRLYKEAVIRAARSAQLRASNKTRELRLF